MMQEMRRGVGFVASLFDSLKPVGGNGLIPIPDSKRDGSLFKNPGFSAQASGNSVNLTSTTEQSNFGQMLAARSNPDKPLLNLQGVPVPLSNVGVSLALILNIAGTDYAVVAYRGGKANRHMLISGYEDLAHSSYGGGYYQVNAQFFRRGAYREFGEELVVMKDRKELVPGQFAQKMLFVDTMNPNETHASMLDHGVDLFFPHQALRGTQGRERFKVTPTPLPSFLGNMLGRQEDESVSVNGTKLQNVGFQYCQSFNSGQLIFPFRIELPNNGAGLSLFHAEDGPIPQPPGFLQTSLNLDGLVLVQLEEGELTGSTFWLRDGELVPRTYYDPKTIKLSEAFDRRPSNSDNLPNWAVNGNDVWFTQRNG